MIHKQAFHFLENSEKIEEFIRGQSITVTDESLSSTNLLLNLGNKVETLRNEVNTLKQKQGIQCSVNLKIILCHFLFRINLNIAHCDLTKKNIHAQSWKFARDLNVRAIFLVKSQMAICTKVCFICFTRQLLQSSV